MHQRPVLGAEQVDAADIQAQRARGSDGSAALFGA